MMYAKKRDICIQRRKYKLKSSLTFQQNELLQKYVRYKCEVSVLYTDNSLYGPSPVESGSTYKKKEKRKY